MNLILFGFKGSGKTHFGKLLAKELHRPFIDTDDLIRDLYASKTKKKLTCRAIYRELGETGFRFLEKEALLSLKTVSGSIIALGGGAVLDPENVEFLEGLGDLVYLDASFDTLQKRILASEAPSFADAEDPVESLRAIYRDRRAIYESIPAEHIHVDLLDEAGALAALRSIAILEK